MKLARTAVLASVVAATTLLAGCSTLKSTMGSSAMTDTLNSVAEVGMPVKVNETFTITKLVKGTNSVTLNVDLAKSATGKLDNYLSSELQGQLANSALCYMPELKTGSTKITLNIYQGGKFKKTINKSAAYLCGN